MMLLLVHHVSGAYVPERENVLLMPSGQGGLQFQTMKK